MFKLSNAVFALLLCAPLALFSSDSPSLQEAVQLGESYKQMRIESSKDNLLFGFGLGLGIAGALTAAYIKLGSNRDTSASRTANAAVAIGLPSAALGFGVAYLRHKKRKKGWRNCLAKEQITNVLKWETIYFRNYDMEALSNDLKEDGHFYSWQDTAEVSTGVAAYMNPLVDSNGGVF